MLLAELLDCLSNELEICSDDLSALPLADLSAVPLDELSAVMSVLLYILKRQGSSSRSHHFS